MEQEKQMRQFLAATALALAIATPAVIVAAPAFAQADVYGQNSLSPDPQIRSYQEYQRLVAQANNYRLQEQQQEQAPATQHAAISNGASASDAAVGGAQLGVGTSTGATPSMAQSCPGTNEAGQPWQPGEYCLPGGR
jgi:hypothetical protein